MKGGKRKPAEAEDWDGKPYGFVLVLRAIARAAIALQRYPASLRVLCVLAEYMNKDGQCRVSQDTIAARLEISRQAVNKHLTFLCQEDRGLLTRTSGMGATCRYSFNFEGLADARHAEECVAERREERRVVKAIARIKAAGGKVVEHADRIGYDAYKAKRGSSWYPGDDTYLHQAEAALAAAAAAAGVRYELLGTINYVRHYHEVQLSEVAGVKLHDVA